MNTGLYWSLYILMRCRRVSIRVMFEGDGKKMHP